MALLLAFVSPTTYQQSPRDYYQFLNHGYKFGQTSKELSKLKVDVLGKVLKKHVTQLRSGRCPVPRSSAHTQTYSGFPSEAVLALSMTTNCGHKVCFVLLGMLRLQSVYVSVSPRPVIVCHGLIYNIQ